MLVCLGTALRIALVGIGMFVLSLEALSSA
jgi:hypothetical protein